MYLCLSVCVRLNNSRTAGPIWQHFFLVSSILVRGWFLVPKILDPESNFSAIPENNPVIIGYYFSNFPEIFSILHQNTF